MQPDKAGHPRRFPALFFHPWMLPKWNGNMADLARFAGILDASEWAFLCWLDEEARRDTGIVAKPLLDEKLANLPRPDDFYKWILPAPKGFNIITPPRRVFTIPEHLRRPSAHEQFDAIFRSGDRPSLSDWQRQSRRWTQEDINRARRGEAPAPREPAIETVHIDTSRLAMLLRLRPVKPAADQNAGDAVPSEADLLSGEAKALALLVQHPDWSDQKIADAADCNRTSLYRWPNYKAARESLKAGRRNAPRGSKDAETGDIEAWE